MGKFELYTIDLKNLTPGTHDFEYLLENKFFVDIDGNEVHKGHVHVQLTVKKSSMAFELNFQIAGMVIVLCDRCLDDMELPIETQDKLIVKFGKEYAEESDEIVIVPEEEGTINVAWFMYEFIALAIPIKHVHAAGKCNKAMAAKLRKHTARSLDDLEEPLDEEQEEVSGEQDAGASDPRWDALKGLFENDNN